MHTGYTREILH